MLLLWRGVAERSVAAAAVLCPPRALPRGEPFEPSVAAPPRGEEERGEGGIGMLPNEWPLRPGTAGGVGCGGNGAARKADGDVPVDRAHADIGTLGGAGGTAAALAGDPPSPFSSAVSASAVAAAARLEAVGVSRDVPSGLLMVIQPTGFMPPASRIIARVEPSVSSSTRHTTIAVPLGKIVICVEFGSGLTRTFSRSSVCCGSPFFGTLERAAGAEEALLLDLLADAGGSLAAAGGSLAASGSCKELSMAARESNSKIVRVDVYGSTRSRL